MLPGRGSGAYPGGNHEHRGLRNAGADVAIGVLVWELEVVGARSLKDKRSVVRSLKDRLHERFRVAVAETGHLDLWQRAELTACAVSGERLQTEKVLQHLDDFVAADSRVRIIAAHRSYH